MALASLVHWHRRSDLWGSGQVEGGLFLLETIMFHYQGNFIRTKPARRAALECGDKYNVGLILTDLPTRCLPDAPAGVAYRLETGRWLF